MRNSSWEISKRFGNFAPVSPVSNSSVPVYLQPWTKHQALLHSQSGTYAGRVFTALPTAPEFRIADDPFRVLLLRLRMPLPLAGRRCRCHRLLDPLGDHRAACSTVEILGLRGEALERAVARMTREAGAHVGWNMMLRDMNLDTIITDERRIEIVANGFPIWHGAQVAIDTSLVSPVRGNGTARPHAADTSGTAIAFITRRKRHRTYREIANAERCRLVVFVLEVGGQWGDEALDLLHAWRRGQPTRLRH